MEQPGSHPADHNALPIPQGVLWASYALLGGLLLYAVVARWFLPLCLDEPIGVERAAGGGSHSAVAAATQPIVFDDRVDPNVAGWPELTRLPGIGEVTAKRIVAYREEHRENPHEPVFLTAEDLGRVRGIGPKTIEAITPHLKFAD